MSVNFEIIFIKNKRAALFEDRSLGIYCGNANSLQLLDKIIYMQPQRLLHRQYIL